ncbi:MAG: MerR family transcriptional regulator [Geobacteraceae bacterium]|nr:MerR family transcriptional regulator [Geobacteraceae bacterium]
MGTTFPDKLYYKIGEVAQMAGVKTSVLRFWESEFDFLSPEKSTSGQRLYSKHEVDLILQVRTLLYDEKFTIEGVKKRISPKGKLINPNDISPVSGVGDHSVLLKEIREALQILRRKL